MSTFRGSDGAVKLDSTAVGELQDWELDISREVIETTAAGAAAKTFTLDISGTTGRIRVNFDYGDAKQAALVDILIAGTVPTALAAQFLVDGASSTKHLDGNILPTSGRIVSQRGPNNVTMEIPIVVTGAVSVTWT